MLFLVWSAMRLAPRLFGVRADGGDPRDRHWSPWHDAAALPLVCQPRLDLQAPDVADAVDRRRVCSPIRPEPASCGCSATGPHCVCELAATLGERENNVSNHLGRLRDAGLVSGQPSYGERPLSVLRTKRRRGRQGPRHPARYPRLTTSTLAAPDRANLKGAEQAVTVKSCS